MRYGIFSDVHSNLEALQAVVNFYKREKIQRLFCIGDIVGYGANPKECITIVKEICYVVVAGNHDWAVADRFNIEYLNDYAKEAIIWTKDIINLEEINFLDSLKLIYKEEDITLVHSSLFNPEGFGYIRDRESALKCFSLLETNKCFIGHSHIPGLFIWDKQDNLSFFSDCIFDFELKDDKKYIINVGSVGQPRDGNYRACCCIYDTETKRISFKRIDYDVKSTVEKILQAALPSFLAYRLLVGR